MKATYVASRIIHWDHLTNCQTVTLIIIGRKLHHSMVRKQFIEKLKHDTLDTLIAVGHFQFNSRVEIFSLSTSKWQTKSDFPYSEDITGFSILSMNKNFFTFGGFSYKRKALTNYVLQSRDHLKIYFRIAVFNSISLVFFCQYKITVISIFPVKNSCQRLPVLIRSRTAGRKWVI